MKIFVSQSAEVTQQTLKRKMKIGAKVQLLMVASPSEIGTLGRGKASVTIAHNYVVTDIQTTKSGDIKNCTLTVKGPKPSPTLGLKSVEVLTATTLAKLMSTKLNKDSKVGTKSLKFVTVKSKDTAMGNAKDSKLAQLKDKVKELESAYKKAISDYHKAETAVDKADNALDKAKRALDLYMSKTL
jgi:hypothetical protein